MLAGTARDGLSGVPKPILNLLVYFSSSCPKHPTWEKPGWKERLRRRSRGRGNRANPEHIPGGRGVMAPTQDPAMPMFCNRGEDAPSLRPSIHPDC